MAKSRSRRSRSRSSTPRSDRRRRSRSRERNRERRRRYSSTDSDSSSDYDRRSRKQESRRRHSRSRSRSRERRRRPERRRDSPKRKSLTCEKESKLSDLAKEIPGYKEMTPAERVKARMKIMLERASARSQASKQGGMACEANVSDQLPGPSETQLEAVESEDFNPQRFKSCRTVKKPESTPVSESIEVPDDVLSKSHEEAMFGSQQPPQSSEPTLASLGIQIIDPVVSMATFSGKKTRKIETEEERNSRWIEKLKQLRSTHKPPSSVSRL